MTSKKGIIPFQEVLADLFSLFKKTTTKAMIIGGVAQSLVARPRATQDIDVLILVDRHGLEQLFKEGKRFGFKPRISDALDFAKTNRVLLLRHEKSGIDIDIALATLPFEEESFARCKRVKIGKLSIPLPTPEDLIIMKAVAHRPKDLIDLEAIIECHKKIDYSRVKKWVKEFADILGDPKIYSDLLTLIKQKNKTKS